MVFRLFWHLGIMALIYANNFINVLINNKDSVFYPLLAIVVSLGLAQYYKVFDVTNYTQPFFQGMYNTYFLFLIPILLAIVMYYFSFDYFKKNSESGYRFGEKKRRSQNRKLHLAESIWNTWEHFLKTTSNF